MKTLKNALIVILTSSICFAGSLEPNAAPAPTMKTMDQVEPRVPITSVPITITQSGSYYLTKNLTSDSNGIIVDANDVTIDLCGFTLTGPGSGSNYGVNMSNRGNVEIRNGTIKNFGSDGIRGANGSGNNRIIGIKSISNGGSGIYLYNTKNIVKDCTVSHNRAAVSYHIYGIYTQQGSKVTGNIVSDNGSSATGDIIALDADVSIVTGNTVCNNGTSAAGDVTGIFAGKSIITGNRVYSNGSSAGGNVKGINCDIGSTITDNVVTSNGGHAQQSVFGIFAYYGNTIKGNTVCSNGSDAAGTVYGIFIQHDNLVDQNVAYSNGINIHESGAGNVITANNVLP